MVQSHEWKAAVAYPAHADLDYHEVKNLFGTRSSLCKWYVVGRRDPSIFDPCLCQQLIMWLQESQVLPEVLNMPVKFG